MVILLACLKAGDAGCEGYPVGSIPEPRYCGERDAAVGQELCVSAFLGCNEGGRKVGLDQTAGQEEPSMVGDDADLLPPGIEEVDDPSLDRCEFAVQNARQPLPLSCPSRSMFPHSVHALPSGSPSSFSPSTWMFCSRRSVLSAEIWATAPVLVAGVRFFPAASSPAMGMTAGFAVSVMEGRTASRWVRVQPAACFLEVLQ